MNYNKLTIEKKHQKFPQKTYLKINGQPGKIFQKNITLWVSDIIHNNNKKEL